ncbi:hypothetical protein OIO90_002542 [Microbotryomycetes sp. JL221]|nr:hypothetical protein OIO90_002542 [Microbotryomycetes sp. JL221]
MQSGQGLELPLNGLERPLSQYSDTSYVRGRIASVNRVQSLKGGIFSFSFQLAPINSSGESQWVQLRGDRSHDARKFMSEHLNRDIKLFKEGVRLRSHAQTKNKECLSYEAVFKGMLLDKDGDENDDEPFDFNTEVDRKPVITPSSPEKQTPELSQRQDLRPSTSMVDSNEGSSIFEDREEVDQAGAKRQTGTNQIQSSVEKIAPLRDKKRMIDDGTVLSPSKQGNAGPERSSSAEVNQQPNKKSRNGKNKGHKKPEPNDWIIDELRQDNFNVTENGRIVYRPFKLIPEGYNVVGYNIIARVVSHGPPKQGRGGSFFLTLSLYDATCFTKSSGDNEQFNEYEELKVPEMYKCRLFSKRESDLPLEINDGEVMILQKLGKGTKSDGVHFVGMDGKQWRIQHLTRDLVKQANVLTQLPRPMSNNRVASIRQSEITKARLLFKWTKSPAQFGQVENAATDNSVQEQSKEDVVERSKIFGRVSSKRPSLTISQLRPEAFADVRAKVVSMFPPESSMWMSGDQHPVSLFVTDYTSNAQMFNYDETNSNFKDGPWGQLVLQVSVFGAQKNALPKIGEKNRFVLLRNLNTRLNENGFLEGKIHEDFKFKNKEDITVIPDTNEWIRELKAREKEYNSKMKSREPLPSLALSVKNNVEASMPTLAMSNPTNHVRISGSQSIQVKSIKTLLTTPNTTSLTNIAQTLEARIVGYSPLDLKDWILAFCSGCEAKLEGPARSCSCGKGEEGKMDVMIWAVLQVKDDSVSTPQPVHFSIEKPAEAFPGLRLTARAREGENDESFLEFRSRMNPLIKPMDGSNKTPLFRFQVEVDDKQEGNKVAWYWSDRTMRINGFRV